MAFCPFPRIPGKVLQEHSLEGVSGQWGRGVRGQQVERGG